MKSTAVLFFFFFFFTTDAGAQPPHLPNEFFSSHLHYLVGQIIIVLTLTFAIYLSCKGIFYIYIRYFSAAAAQSDLRRRAMADASALQIQIRMDGDDSRGLDPSVIHSFPILKYSDIKHRRIGEDPLECAVCLTDFNKDNETLRLLPACNHAFHPTCIDRWLEARVTCPVCRAVVTPDAEKPARVSPEVDSALETANMGNNEETVIQLVDDNQPPADPNRIAPPVKSFSHGQFRSHSTGHSLDRSPPVENLERFTLRLPAEAWEELNRRYGIGGGGIADRRIKSDRWAFSGERSAMKKPDFRWLEFKDAGRPGTVWD